MQCRYTIVVIATSYIKFIVVGLLKDFKNTIHYSKTIGLASTVTSLHARVQIESGDENIANLDKRIYRISVFYC